MFGVGKFAIAWLWCNNQGIVQSLGYFGEGVEGGCFLLRCCMAMLTRGAPEKSVQRNLFRPELAFLIIVVLCITAT